jgi:superfamily II DNA/RNA helicase
LHGDLTQLQRLAALEQFRAGEVIKEKGKR